MNVRRGSLVAWALAALVLLAGTAQAQSLRDPTVAPAQAEADGASQAPATAPGYAVVIQNGKPHLVVGTRLVPVGQKVGNARLERITETEIWFREGGQLRKEARFSGIRRTTASTPADCAAPPAASHAKPRPKSSKPRAATTAAPCEGAKP